SLQPNAVSFASALVACLDSGRWALALELCEHMAKCKVDPDLSSYSRVLM
ncbi:unnamed protein product, partial [Polarella glacialis]